MSQSWKDSSLTPFGFGNNYRDHPKRQDKSYQRFIMSSKQGRAKDRVLEEDELELRQYENWI